MNPRPPHLIVIDPEIMGGTPCFRGTRVPFQHLLDHLEGHYTLDEFLEIFDISREDAAAVLEALAKLLTEAPQDPHTAIIVTDPEIMGGTPCFRGTRVPFASGLIRPPDKRTISRCLAVGIGPACS